MLLACYKKIYIPWFATSPVHSFQNVSALRYYGQNQVVCYYQTIITTLCWNLSLYLVEIILISRNPYHLSIYVCIEWCLIIHFIFFLNIKFACIIWSVKKISGNPLLQSQGSIKKWEYKETLQILIQLFYHSIFLWQNW